MSSTAQTYYKAARDEIIVRIRMRDTILLAYNVSAASIIGLSITDISGLGSTVALIVPFLAIGCSILVSSHSIAITALGNYTNQLKLAIDACRNHKDVKIEPWDYSATFMRYASKHALSRLKSHIWIIRIPALTALYVASENFVYPLDVYSIIFSLGVLMTIFSMYELIRAHWSRMKAIEKRSSEYFDENPPGGDPT